MIEKTFCKYFKDQIWEIIQEKWDPQKNDLLKRSTPQPKVDYILFYQYLNGDSTRLSPQINSHNWTSKFYRWSQQNLKILIFSNKGSAIFVYENKCKVSPLRQSPINFKRGSSHLKLLTKLILKRYIKRNWKKMKAFMDIYYENDWKMHNINTFLLKPLQVTHCVVVLKEKNYSTDGKICVNTHIVISF